MTVALSALPQFFDNAGNPLSGGKVYTYAAGTVNPLSTYTDRGGLTANANPVVLDSAGRADIWLSTNIAYKLIVQDSAGNVMDSVDQFYAGADPSQLTTAGIVPSTGGTYTGLVDFTGGATFSGTAVQDLATLDSLGISAVQNANLWANSDAAIWQRSAVTTVADATNDVDRFINLCDTGNCTISLANQPEDGTLAARRALQPDASPKRIGFEQIVEWRAAIPLRGKSLTFTARLRASTGVTVRMALVAWTGTADAPTRDVVNSWTSTNYTAGNFFVANTLTIATAAQALTANTWTDVTVSSASAGGVVVPSTTNNLYMVVWTESAVAQNVTLDASRLRCGLGTSVQIWTPPDPATEIVRCMREMIAYSAPGPIANGGWTQSTSSTVSLLLRFPRMRVAPTLNAGNGTYTIFDGTGQLAVTALTASFSSPDSMGLDSTSAGIVASRPASLYISTGSLWLSTGF